MVDWQHWQRVEAHVRRVWRGKARRRMLRAIQKARLAWAWNPSQLRGLLVWYDASEDRLGLAGSAIIRSDGTVLNGVITGVEA